MIAMLHESLNVDLCNTSAAKMPDPWVSHRCYSEPRELEYQTAGVTGQVLTDREPLLVLDVAADPNLHWFARKPTRLMGSYYVAPLIDEDGAVWGVLGVDTLLDGRTLTGEDTEKIAAITSRANPVLCQILANLPPSPEPEEEAAEEAAGDGGEPAEGGEGETA